MSSPAIHKTLLVAIGAVLAGTLFAAPASADCGSVNTTGDMRSVHCTYGGDPESSDDPTPNWTVPPAVTEATFEVWGGDDLRRERIGGYVRARLPLRERERLGLSLGYGGGASSVSRAESVLLLAGGGDGQLANFVDPSAEDVSSLPSAPGSFRQHGTIDIEWRIPDECVVPKLRGRRLPAARHLLQASHCRIGRVSRRPARPGLRNRVLEQDPHAGIVRPPHGKVDLTLGTRP